MIQVFKGNFKALGALSKRSRSLLWDNKGIVSSSSHTPILHIGPHRNRDKCLLSTSVLWKVEWPLEEARKTVLCGTRIIQPPAQRPQANHWGQIPASEISMLEYVVVYYSIL